MREGGEAMTMRVTRAEFLGLEPCPHCGGEAEFDWITGAPSLRVIRCECGAMITMGNVTDAFDGELAELWNNRAVVELEAELRKQVDSLTAELRESREYAEDLSGACELLDGVNEELREQVDELEAERDEWKAKAEQATNQPTSQSDAPKTEETAENGATKSEMRDFDDSREKLEADAISFLYRVEDGDWVDKEMRELLDRQAAITEREVKLELLFDSEQPLTTALMASVASNLAEKNGELREEVAELRAKLREIAGDGCSS